MLKKPLFFMAVFVLLAAGVARPARAAAEASNEQDLEKTLEVNRSMLSQFESEYLTLKQVSAKNAPIVKTEMRKLEYKMKALDEDRRRLVSHLSDDARAQAFLEDVVHASDTHQLKVRRAAPGFSPRATKLHEEALKLVEQKKMNQALEIYQEIILENPDDDQAYIIMGHIYLLTGQYEKAEIAFHNAAHIDPNDVNQILPFYQNIIVQNPNDDDAYANLGFAYLFLGDLMHAKESFEDSLSINPDNAGAKKGMTTLASL